jgi:hypothetical protein
MKNEIYILLESFARKDIDLFRSNYLKGFLPVADYFEYPPFPSHSGNQFETDNMDEMIEFMSQGGKGYFRFYLRPPFTTEILMGMIFFNHDNTLTLGISISSKRNDLFINKLVSDFKSNLIMICEGPPPPSNKDEFIKIINTP